MENKTTVNLADRVSVLQQIAESKDGVFAKDLTEMTRWPRPIVFFVISDLEKLGLIRSSFAVLVKPTKKKMGKAARKYEATARGKYLLDKLYKQLHPQNP